MIDGNGALAGVRTLRFVADGASTDDYDWRMTISGTTNSAPYFMNDVGTLRFEFTDAGDFNADGNIVAYYSDECLKRITSDLSECRVAINQWKPIRYIPNDTALSLDRKVFKANKEEIGLSAQSVQATHPQLVAPAPFDINEQGDSKSGEHYLTLDYQRCVAVLVGALQEQDTELRTLQQDINQLKQHLGLP